MRCHEVIEELLKFDNYENYETLNIDCNCN